MSSAPEYDLLLDAAVPLTRRRADYDGWDGGRWGQALNAADWHRLSPALFCHLQDAGGAPPAVLSALERAYLANAARMLFVSEAIDGAVGALDAAGIPALLLKGAALVETVYTDPAQREMLDIDLLVDRDRLDAANAALAPLGYRRIAAIDPATGLSNHQHVHHDPALVGAERVVAVELHHHVAIAGEGRAFPISGFWERARTAPRTGHRLCAPEDLLLHVCFHFTRNRLGGSAEQRNTGGALAQVGDMHRIIAGEPLDWDAFVARTRSYGLGARVFLGLFAAHELGVAVPSTALAALAPPRFEPEIGRRLVALRVLRAGEHLPVRSLRFMFAPSREVLSRGWNADPTAPLSLAGAYLRRAQAHVPAARTTLRRPWAYVQDHRLNSQIKAMEDRV